MNGTFNEAYTSTNGSINGNLHKSSTELESLPKINGVHVNNVLFFLIYYYYNIYFTFSR